ncbi:DUF4268 domain-containing protein [Algoriphagus kandeliae]|uniref:DUF4268 domain-containing protein n=1 Tax=Algoriphagus kandeliae TaxID=2562278 RepID=A0A4Y9QNN9_9BACT|nr:DUF4268 domain-containing protein [Algoriphagus kandeliae]TFV94209.1 DUF4268 domain-containing protein [Algoriphagus kandeliae]
MYSRSETSRIRKSFWIAFGQYMRPVPNAQGGRVNWQNYKTGVKDIYFRLRAERGYATVGIEVTHKDEELQQLFFEQLMQLRKILEQCTGEVWDWQLHQANEFGQLISKVEKRMDGVDVMNENDWPAIISFLKPRIIALDEFWDLVKPGFEDF